eukprot:TRINITY_DN655_c0_g2_i1.p1 TRINITY_DN655_c0_g2~~TRINITY_DN655_c0_g2_i1.p1  ORF type:complete len:342 (-),score=118.62 TRINITY_DN655_c0_g2_i1:46-1071(-)
MFHFWRWFVLLITILTASIYIVDDYFSPLHSIKREPIFHDLFPHNENSSTIIFPSNIQAKLPLHFYSFHTTIFHGYVSTRIAREIIQKDAPLYKPIKLNNSLSPAQIWIISHKEPQTYKQLLITVPVSNQLINYNYTTFEPFNFITKFLNSDNTTKLFVIGMILETGNNLNHSIAKEIWTYAIGIDFQNSGVFKFQQFTTKLDSVQTLFEIEENSIDGNKQRNGKIIIKGHSRRSTSIIQFILDNIQLVSRFGFSDSFKIFYQQTAIKLSLLATRNIVSKLISIDIFANGFSLFHFWNEQDIIEFSENAKFGKVLKDLKFKPVIVQHISRGRAVIISKSED